MKNLPKRSLLFQDSRLFACVILEHCMNPAMCWWMCDKWPLKTTKMLVHAEACKFTDGSPPGLSIHGILQARILEWVAISSSRGCFLSRNRTHVSRVSCTGRQVLCHWHHLGSPDEVLTPQDGRKYLEIGFLSRLLRTNKLIKRDPKTI